MKVIMIALMVAMAPVVTAAEESWTGFYAGAQLGFSDLSDDTTSTADSTLGAHAGYLHDFGGYVLGGELSYDAGAEFVSGGSIEKVDTVRAKIKGGRVFGRTMLYGVAGFANMDTAAGNVDGYSVGIGASYRASEKIVVGAEYLHDTFDTTGGNTKADTISLRLSYAF